MEFEFENGHLFPLNSKPPKPPKPSKPPFQHSIILTFEHSNINPFPLRVLSPHIQLTD